VVSISAGLSSIPLYFIAYQVGAVAMGAETFSFDQFSSLFSVDTVMELGTPLLLGCFILMNAGAVLGYYGIQYLWRRSVRHAARLRKSRNIPFNTAIMTSQTYAEYKKYLEHRHPQDKS